MGTRLTLIRRKSGRTKTPYGLLRKALPPPPEKIFFCLQQRGRLRGTGIGLPDIPLFTGMILKSIYEVALHYGYGYDTEEERYFILKLIQVSLLYGEELGSGKSKDRSFYGNEETSRRIRYEEAGQRYLFHAFRRAFIYEIPSGIPVVGAAGGIYDTVYLQRIMNM